VVVREETSMRYRQRGWGVHPAMRLAYEYRTLAPPALDLAAELERQGWQAFHEDRARICLRRPRPTATEAAAIWEGVDRVHPGASRRGVVQGRIGTDQPIDYLRYCKYCQNIIRQGDKVTSRYWGSDLLAAGLAGLDRERRGERERGRRERAAIEAEERRLHAEERDLGRAIAAMVSVGLRPLGLVRYGRHPWRRRRIVETTTMMPARDPREPPAREQIKAAIAEVRAKRPGALVQFEEMASAHPSIVVAELGSDLARLARHALAAQAMSGHDAHRVGLEQQVILVAAELAGASPSPAVRLLSELAAFAWAVHWVAAASAAHKGTDSPASARRQNAALRRFAAAVKAIEQVKGLERG